MKKLLLLVSLAFIGLTAIHAQSSSPSTIKVTAQENSNSYGTKFYFPVKSLSNLIALSKTLPQLADEVIVAYSDSDKTAFYYNAAHYQIIAQHYNKAVALLDSLETIADNLAIGMQFKSYASAKEATANNPASFKKAYTTTFARLFNNLSFGQKIVIVSFFDSASHAVVLKDLHQIEEKLKNDNADSISLKDAQNLIHNYNLYTVYNETAPLLKQFINDPNLKLLYPVIKSYKWAGVVPVQQLDEIPDPNMQYNLLMELTSGIKNKNDSASIHGVNIGLGEIGRLLNLHLTSGIPKANINIVAVVHGPALYALYNNEAYKKKYGVDNPNLPLLKELQEAGVKIISCGQAMAFFNVNREDMIPGIKVSLTAQTVLSGYQLKNYVHYDLSERN